MYDQIESWEVAAESMMDRLHIAGTIIHCPSCNEPFDYCKEGNTLSSHPYSIPVCNKCVAEFISQDASLAAKSH